MNNLHLFDPFVLLLIGASLSIISFTMFVNFVRGVAIIAASIGLIYYFAIATPEDKEYLNEYSKNLYSSVKNQKDLIQKINEVKTSIKEKI